MTKTMPVDGGELVDLTVGSDEREPLLERVASLSTLRLNPRSLSDLELLGNGGFSPLRGFMGRADYKSVVESIKDPPDTIKPGEDVRDGRWWWENPDNKECGLHG